MRIQLFAVEREILRHLLPDGLVKRRLKDTVTVYEFSALEIEVMAASLQDVEDTAVPSRTSLRKKINNYHKLVAGGEEGTL